MWATVSQHIAPKLKRPPPFDIGAAAFCVPIKKKVDLYIFSVKQHYFRLNRAEQEPPNVVLIEGENTLNNASQIETHFDKLSSEILHLKIDFLHFETKYEIIMV